jgi:hypothetical protein
MISAASGQTAPAHAVCSGALLLLWDLIVTAHAFMSSMAFFAWAASPAIAHASAWV